MEENIKETVGSSKPSALSVIIWDISQLSTQKNPASDLLLHTIRKPKNSYTIDKKSPGIPTQKPKLTKY